MVCFQISLEVGSIFPSQLVGANAVYCSGGKSTQFSDLNKRKDTTPVNEEIHTIK
jgi:hypothetical protein